jgi:acyl-[acyl-carrier-protein] desaturase
LGAQHAEPCSRPAPLQTLHSLSKNRLELINSIAPYVEERVLPVLKPVSKCWQPYDMLPKPEDPDFVDQVTIYKSDRHI